MKIQAGQTVLLTGASGGLGVFIARAFFPLGTKLALVAYPGTGLEALRQEAEQHGLPAIAMANDLRHPEQRRAVVERTLKEFGSIDVLINNAGIEFTSAFHDLPEETICDILRVNLESSMIMSRLVLPQMLKQSRGHVVSMSSLAGKAGPAFQEPYAASKAGLVAFSFSLRASYRQNGVSASAIVPGFVEAGIYAKLKEKSGFCAPALLGTSAPETVAKATIEAIERDLPEILINPIPVRPLLALSSLFPALGEWAVAKTGGHDFFRRVVNAEKRKAPPGVH